MPVIITKVLKLVFSRMVCRCIGALGIGLFAATILAFGILKQSGFEATPETAYTIRLPQDEALLKQLSDEILEGTDVAGGENALSDIAPAAGSNTIAE